MPNYAKLHDLVSHRVTLEYDTGARIIGTLAMCQPSSAPVEFCTLEHVQLINSAGDVVNEFDEFVVCPNSITGFRLQEGPGGR